MEIGDVIRRGRQGRGLTQAQLAAELPNEVHAKTIGRWERGKAHPRGQLRALENALGVRLTERSESPADASSDPAAMSDADLVNATMRYVAELARRLPADREI